MNLKSLIKGLVKREGIFIPLFFLLIAVIAYWQVAFLKYSVKWDNMDTVLPWRWFVQECIKGKIFPLWNPYQQFGYPIYADFRSIWSPVTLLFSMLGFWNNYLIHFLSVFYVWLAGFSMYKLVKYLSVSSYSGVVVGIAYMLGGYFVSQFQDMPRIAGAAFLPLVVYQFILFITKINSRQLIRFSLVLFWIITSGYQGITIILFYLLLVLYFQQIVAYFKTDKQKLIMLLKYSGVLGVILFILCFGIAISYLQVTPFVSRFSGLELKDTQQLPFSPQSIISWFYPWSSSVDTHFFNTDSSMSNAYLSVVLLPFLLLSFWNKKNKLQILLMCFALVCLVASFGRYTPIREFLNTVFPLLNLFKASAYFVLFFSFCSLLLLGINGSFFCNKRAINRSIIMISTIVFGLFIWAYFKGEDVYFKELIKNIETDYFAFSQHTNVFTNIKLSLWFQGGLLFVLFLITKLIKNKTKIKLLFLILLLTDLMVNTQLNIPITAVSEYNPKAILSYLKSKPKGFPVTNIQHNLSANYSYGALWRNLGNFEKIPTSDCFNSFKLDGFTKIFNDSVALQTILKHNIIYGSDTFGNEIANSIVYQQTLALPNKFVFEVTSTNGNYLTFLQSNYTGWEVYVDAILQKHWTSNYLFITTKLNRGTHNVTFIYKNTPIVYAAFVSYIGFVLLLIVVIIRFKNRGIKLFFSLLLIFPFIIFLFDINLQNFFSPVDNKSSKLFNYQIKPLSISYNETQLLDSLNIYSSAFELLSNDTLSLTDRTITASVLIKPIPTEAYLVISIERKERILDYHVRKINAKSTSNNHVFETKYLNPMVCKKGDKLIVYIWNYRKNKFYIDDFTVKLSSED